jgi:hypothetical protein
MNELAELLWEEQTPFDYQYELAMLDALSVLIEDEEDEQEA